MPLRFNKNSVVFEAGCMVEDALPLVEFLQSHPGAGVNLRACTHIHTAILQVLMAFRPRVTAEPLETFLQRWLMPLLPPLKKPAAARAKTAAHSQTKRP